MANHLEKRNTPRHPINRPITLHPTISASRMINANLLNFSEQGISFSSDKPLIPGTTIFFRASSDNYRQSVHEVGGQPRSISLMTIKWCKENPKQEKSIHEMGGTYLYPY